MAMNKAVTKQVMERCGIRTAPWREVRYTREDIPRLTEELAGECLTRGVPVIAQYTMAQLGQAAGIQVGASALTVRRGRS